MSKQKKAAPAKPGSSEVEAKTPARPRTPTSSQTPTQGRVVLYHEAGVDFTARIVRVIDADEGIVTLAVDNDLEKHPHHGAFGFVDFKQGVPLADSPKSGTWRWPAYVAPSQPSQPDLGEGVFTPIAETPVEAASSTSEEI